ncbi:unnamed protein product [Phyllotreta striolata]|uniref:Uncharacterized protein n=1 Tax=Phyllotreta striolata TaxID=444603 RepID=A0A9N9XRL3_PHYSR|nr:unnamed protein product [Phyllotreta striolata]
MIQKKASIFLALLALLQGVASLSAYADEDGDILRPFVSNSQKRRICVELCLSGLGGSACGDECADITPTNLPVQSVEASVRAGKAAGSPQKSPNITRDASCDVLCLNGLGQPLCTCDTSATSSRRSEANFLEICSFFCVTYNYRISGCQKCSIYRSLVPGNRNLAVYTRFETTFDWESWCLEQCGRGNGGAACNCDRLPL